MNIRQQETSSHIRHLNAEHALMAFVQQLDAAPFEIMDDEAELIAGCLGRTQHPLFTREETLVLEKLQRKYAKQLAG